MVFRVNKQQLNTSIKQYAINGNLVGIPVFIKEENSCLAKLLCLAALGNWALAGVTEREGGDIFMRAGMHPCLGTAFIGAHRPDSIGRKQIMSSIILAHKLPLRFISTVLMLSRSLQVSKPRVW